MSYYNFFMNLHKMYLKKFKLHKFQYYRLKIIKHLFYLALSTDFKTKTNVKKTESTCDTTTDKNFF
jgi:hypothetical protein